MRVSLSLHLKYKQCWDKQVQLGQTVNVFLVLYIHIYRETYKMLKNGAVYYIHLYFPYILINVVSYMIQEGFARVGDYQYLQI